jgi:quinol-cytochrome oxidoreductase complex cytochrome b subunit
MCKIRAHIYKISIQLIYRSYMLNYMSKSLATVITNLLSAIPVFGQDIVELI